MEILNRPCGTQIRYISLGSGDRTLVFLHGWTASVREWLPFASELADHHRVVCWDARGHGGHHYPDSTDMNLSTMADDLECLLDHLDIKNAILVGHSMGALTSWEYIRRHGQQRLIGLCVVDQSPKLVTDEQWQHGVYSDFSSEKNEQFLARLSEDFAEGVLELIAFGHNRRSLENYQQNSRGFQQMREYLQQQPGKLLTECWRSITEQDYRDIITDIDVSALLIYGDESQFYSADLQQWVDANIKQSELHIYENSDHSPHLWHKERFIFDLNRFTDSI